MHPALIAAMATFGVQKLRGKSTSRSLRDAIMAAGFTYGVGEIGAGIEALGSGQAGAAISATGAGSTAATAEGLSGGISSLGTQFGVGGGTPSQFLLGTSPEALSLSSAASGVPQGAAGIAQSFAPQPLTGIAAGTRDLLSGTEVGTNISEAYKAGMEKFDALNPMTKFAIKYAAAPVATALLTPEEIPEGMSREEFLKLDSETRTRLLAEARQGVKGLGEKAQPLRTQSDPYNYQRGNPLYTPFNQGGIVSALPRYAQGGVNYLPSKVTHDENDVHNYVRATGYVEDGSGTGDKDEDTILAQLADGEFVSRADAVLGAGIMAGASPASMKDMRAKGASYFYEQQARFKRIFDLINANRPITTN